MKQQMNQPTTDIPISERILLFMDILGSKKHIEENLSKILEIVTYLSTLQSKFQIERKTSHSIEISVYHIKPEVFSFSDHIVISYPRIMTQIDDDSKFIEDGKVSLHSSIQNLLNIGTYIYKYSLERGILMRGALTIGELHHDSNIIIGKALIDAVELEENTAIYPRIIVSNEFITLYNSVFRGGSDPLLRDFDGIYYIDFLKSNSLYHDKELNSLIAFFQNLRKYIEENLQKHHDQLRVLAKWQWLAYKFDEALGFWEYLHESLRTELSKITRFKLTSTYWYESFPRVKEWDFIRDKFPVTT